MASIFFPKIIILKVKIWTSMKQEPLTGKTNMPRISCLRKVTIICGCGVRYNWYTVVTILEDDENGKRSKTWGVGGGGESCRIFFTAQCWQMLLFRAIPTRKKGQKGWFSPKMPVMEFDFVLLFIHQVPENSWIASL